MSARIFRRWYFHGKEYRTFPKANIVAAPAKVVRSTIHHLGGGLVSPIIVHRLGAYVGGNL